MYSAGIYTHKITKGQPLVSQNTSDGIINSQGMLIAPMIRLDEEGTIPIYITREDFDKEYELIPQESSTNPHEDLSSSVTESKLTESDI